MSDDSETAYVLLIQIHDGKITEVRNECRVVYKNTKGRYINVANSGYGRVYIESDNVAIVDWIRWRRPNFPQYTARTVQPLLHQFFSDKGLTDFIKEI